MPRRGSREEVGDKRVAPEFNSLTASEECEYMTLCICPNPQYNMLRRTDFA